MHAEDEPLHEQHVEDDEIRRAKNVRGREHEKRDDRGYWRGHDVEEEVGDLHVAAVVQVALEEALDNRRLEVDTAGEACTYRRDTPLRRRLGMRERWDERGGRQSSVSRWSN